MQVTSVAEDRRRERVIVSGASRPQLVKFVRLHHDKERDRWVLLAPERVLTPNEVAIDVLGQCDGARTVDDISLILADEYDAPPDAIASDILPLLQGLADDGYLTA